MKIRVVALALVVASACGAGSEATVVPADSSAPGSKTVTTTAIEDSGAVETWEEIEAHQEMVEDQFWIWENWLNNYPSHPVLGGHWTEADAECVIFAMWRDRGVHETDTQFKEATQGGMAREDAEFLVRPVADCVDLRAMVRADMLQDGVEDPDCLLAEVTEEQIVSWFVADFTDGPDGFGQLFWQDINQSC